MAITGAGGDLGRAVAVELELGLSGHEVKRRLLAAHRAGDVCAHALAFYLHELESRGLHQEAGFSSAVDFAVRQLDMPESTARGLITTGRRLVELPQLAAAFAAGEVVWSKVRRIARIATPETEADVIDVATSRHDYEQFFEWAPDGKSLRFRSRS